MNIQEKARAYDEALEKAKEIKSKILHSHLSTESCKEVSEYIDTIIPELREKPLTPFQQCLNLILQKVYYASVPGKTKDVNKFILDIVKNRTDELVELAKKHEYTDCQLRESEDERIRKELIEFIREAYSTGNAPEKCAKWLVWLDLQKEQKPLIKKGVWKPSHNTLPIEQQVEAAIEKQVEAAMIAIRGEMPSKSQEWSEDDEDNLKAIIRIIEDNDSDWKELTDWLKSFPERLSLQPKQEWSEEDEDMLNCCISSIEEAKENRYAYKETDGDTSYDREIAFLKSLRPSWRPSEEQMNGLAHAINLDVYDAKRYALDSLYNDLKKLM